MPALHDLDVRRRIIDSFPDYKQVISLAAPTLEQVAKGDPAVALEFAKIGNDGMAELCRNIRISSRASSAQTPLTAKEPALPRRRAPINELGACGTQIFTNVEGKPLDRPEFRPFFAAMEKLDKPIWVHPSRSANFPDYLDEKKSLYEIWWTFGWAYETAAMMSRWYSRRFWMTCPS